MDAKTILVIDPLEKIISSLQELANVYGDRLVTIGRTAIKAQSEHIVIDIFNKIDEIPILLKQLDIIPNVIFTLNETYGKQVQWLCEYYNIENIQNNSGKLRDKKKMKKVFTEYQIPHAQEHFLDNILNSKGNVEELFPLIVKPSTGYASIGVKKVNNLRELQKCIHHIDIFNNSLLGSDQLIDKSYIIEEFLWGEEYACDSLWLQGKRIASIIQRNDGFKHGTYFPDTIYYIDPYISEELKNKIYLIEEQLNIAFSNFNGFTHTEYKVNDLEINVIETTNRPGAGGGFLQNIYNSTGINLLKLFYEGAIHFEKIEPVEAKYDIKKKFFWYVPQIEGKGRIDNIEGLEDIKTRENIHSVEQYIVKGNYLYPREMRPNYPVIITGWLNSDSNVNKELQKIQIDVKFELT